MRFDCCNNQSENANYAEPDERHDVVLVWCLAEVDKGANPIADLISHAIPAFSISSSSVVSIALAVCGFLPLFRYTLISGASLKPTLAFIS